MLRIIREEEPPKPSTRLSTIDTLPSVAANRRMEPQRLSALVRGELDWIVMKALEKDRGPDIRRPMPSAAPPHMQRSVTDNPEAVQQRAEQDVTQAQPLATLDLVADSRLRVAPESCNTELLCGDFLLPDY